MRKHLILISQGTICGLLVIAIVYLWRKGWNLLLGLLQETPYQEIALGTIVTLSILFLLQTIYILHLYKVIDSEKEKWNNPSVMHDDELLKRILKPSPKKE